MQQDVVLSLPDYDPVGVVVIAADGLAVGVFAVGGALVGQEGTEEAQVGPPHFVWCI